MKRILKMIRAMKLAPGDKLPPQDEIRKSLGLTNFVISKAMDRLRQHGAISRKRSEGTILVGLDKLPLETFCIGIMSKSPSLDKHNPSLLISFSYLVGETFAQGFDCHPLVSRRTHPAFGASFIQDFHGLDECIDDCIVDALICSANFDGVTSRKLDKTGLPIAETWHEGISCGALMDTGGMVLEAMRIFYNSGCRTFGIVNMDKPKPGHQAFWTSCQNTLSSLGLPSSNGRFFTSMMKAGNEGGGFIAADQILTLEQSRRPDALIVMDDRVAIGLLDRLAGTESYRPQIAVLSNMQIPVEYKLPTLKFGLDMEEFASLAVSAAAARITAPHLHPKVELVPLRLLDDENSR